MSPPSSYQDAARAYTAGVRALFALPAAVIARLELHRTRRSRSRSGRYPGDPGRTTGAAVRRLHPGGGLATGRAGPDGHADTAAQLLTKALTDLQISAQLLQAAMDEEAVLPATRGVAVERGVSIAAPSDLEENLRFLMSEPGPRRRRLNVGLASFPADCAGGPRPTHPAQRRHAGLDPRIAPARPARQRSAGCWSWVWPRSPRRPAWSVWRLPVRWGWARK